MELCVGLHSDDVKLGPEAGRGGGGGTGTGSC